LCIGKEIDYQNRGSSFGESQVEDFYRDGDSGKEHYWKVYHTFYEEV